MGLGIGPDGRGDDVKCVGVAPGFGLEDGVAMFALKEREV